MDKTVEIIRLSEAGVAQRDICAALRSSFSTVSKTLKAAREKDLKAAQLADKDSRTVRQLLFGPGERAGSYEQPDFAWMEAQLKRDGVTLTLLWDEYTRSCAASGAKGYQYTQFCELWGRWRKDRGISAARLRIQRVPGRLVEVDWAGMRAEYVDRTTGEIRRPWVFVGCLPYSQKLFAAPFNDMAQPSWIRAHVAMLRYFGGVPELVTPDNCKTGVAKPDYYDPVVNKDYARLAAHYGFAVVPARPVTPRDKGSVENTVKFVQTWVVAYLREQRFFSLGEVDQAIKARIATLNAQPLKAADVSRNDVFDEEEAPCLKPLPAHDFELAEWRRGKVGIDYCVQVDHQRYSVPYRLIGDQVDIRVTDQTIEVFHGGARIGSHARLTGRMNQASVLPEHMPDKHKMALEAWNPDRFTRWAASIGPACLQVITAILASKPHPAQSYRACLGVLGIAKSRGNAFLEQVCQQAAASSSQPSYKQIALLAKHPQPARIGDTDRPDLPGVGSGGMVRGADYYKITGSERA